MKSNELINLLQLPERVYSADVVYPMACVALANKVIIHIFTATVKYSSI